MANPGLGSELNQEGGGEVRSPSDHPSPAGWSSCPVAIQLSLGPQWGCGGGGAHNSSVYRSGRRTWGPPLLVMAKTPFQVPQRGKKACLRTPVLAKPINPWAPGMLHAPRPGFCGEFCPSGRDPGSLTWSVRPSTIFPSYHFARLQQLTVPPQAPSFPQWILTRHQSDGHRRFLDMAHSRGAGHPRSMETA